MTFYTDLAATALDLLTEFGADGVVTRTVVTSGGPADITGGSTTVTPYTLKTAVFEVSEDRIDGTNVLAGDFQVIVQANDVVEIAPGDTVTVSHGGRELNMTIMRLGKIAPAGVIVAYDMVCRGG